MTALRAQSGSIETAPSNTAPRRLRVLVSAFATAARGGSEVAIGWQLCRNLAKHHDITVLCAPASATENFRDRNDEYLAKHGPVDGLTLHYVEPPLLSRWLQRGHMKFLKPFYYLGYAAWQRAALRAARELHSARRFDVVHQLNMTGFREPGFLWKLDVPFVWGPIGGAGNFPSSYFETLSSKEQIFYRLRNWSNEFQKRFARRPRVAARRAAILSTIGEENAEMVQTHWERSSRVTIESGCDDEFIEHKRSPPADRTFRIAWSGLLVGRKALPLLLRSLARLPHDLKWSALIIGDGSERRAWQSLADSLGVSNRMEWAGSLEHKQAIVRMSECDVLAFTSLQEGTPVTVVEALALGMPVICHACCGMGIAVTEQCGILIPPRDIETSVAGFAKAIEQLAHDRELLRKLSDGALKRSREVTWSNIAAQIAQDYERAVSVGVNP